MSASEVTEQDGAELEAAEMNAAAARESEDFAAERDAQVADRRFVGGIDGEDGVEGCDRAARIAG
jgi:conjugal transfer/entry exclusion protein